MRNALKKAQSLLVLCLALSGTSSVKAQCLTLTAAPSITVAATTGSCGAIVNYGSPTIASTCSIVTTTFNYLGSIQNWTVPSGVTTLTITAKGAQGGYNTSSGSITSGLGAQMKGVFTVTSGQVLKILVGQQPSNGSGNGGGGGSFVTNSSNSPLIVAGGGGGSAQTTDSPSKHGQTTTAGGAGAAGGGAGGTSGNGGGIGGSGFQAGAGAGILTNGADGWTSGSGGFAFVNGGAPTSVNAPANGGFGGGGSGSSYVVGGGGGGYSGGGSGGNSTAGVGGGGGSYNGGTSQVNTSGANSGDGQIVINYAVAVSQTVTQTTGLISGATFPIGTSVQTFSVVDSFNNSASASFSVTVQDLQNPTISCPGNTVTCIPAVTGIAPLSVADNCPSPAVTYTFAGATSGSGSSNASGTTFNVGVTTVSYIATDNSGNKGSCTFSVTVNPIPVVSAASNTSAICNGQSATLTATGANSYSWGAAGSGSAIAVNPSSTTSYTVTGTTAAGCSNTFAITQTVNQNPTVAAISNFNQICAGASATLLATGAVNYSWSTGATTSVISVSPPVTTTYTVTGTGSNGCTGTLAITQTVNPLPLVIVTTNTNTLCDGETGILSGSGADTYTWSNGQQASTIPVNPSVTTSYSVTGTNTLTGCTNSVVLSLSVNPSPTVSAVSNSTVLCSGGSATLTAGGADSYTWSTMHMTSTVAVSPTVSTTYSVLGSYSLTGCMTMSFVTLLVNPNPTVTIAGTSSICSGNAATLTASGANTYSWNTGATGATLIDSPNASTAYTVVGFNAAGCSDIYFYAVQVLPSPTIIISSSASLICSGETTTLSTGGAFNYQWDGGQTTQMITVSPLSTTAYSVLATDANGCADAASFTVEVNACTGLEKATKAGYTTLNVYPNPGKDLVSLRFNGNVTPATVRVYNALGELVLEQANVANEAQLDLSGLSNGLYFVNLVNGEKLMGTARFVMQK